MKNLSVIFSLRDFFTVIAGIAIILTAMTTFAFQNISQNDVGYQQQRNSPSVHVAMVKMPKRPGVAIPVKKA